ncbi:DUF3558 family protein [Dactylosporangium sp. NPDC051484]|uniref:DUF3558 family protein n=1 Tax=Dactylosporangium sp. NPDC051484 TaxID=3154942 RepID=UPI00344E95AB
MRKTVRTFASTAGLVGALALAGCGGSDEPAVSAPPAAPTAAQAGGGPAAAAPVDTCALFTPADAATVLGKPGLEPTPQKAEGSLLGGCTYTRTDGASVNITARPAREWDSTKKSYNGTPVSGVGKDAVWADKVGLLVLPEGKPYFLHVLVIANVAPLSFDKDRSVTVGKIAVGR